VSRRARRARRDIGETRVEDFSSAHQIVEAAHDLLGRCHAVGEMHPVEIDTIGREPAQARLDRSDHGLAAVAGRQDAAAGCRAERELGGEDEIVAPALQERADELLDSPNW